jgi:putative transposase
MRRWCVCGSPARRRAFRCWWSSACDGWSEGAAGDQEHGQQSSEAWRTVLDNLIKRGLKRPEFLIVDGARALEKAITAVWDTLPVQRCTVHKHPDLLAHAPERLHEEITAGYNDMMYAARRQKVEARRKVFIRKWRLKHRAVAGSLEEAGERLFTFTRLPANQWRSVHTTNAVERLHEITVH